VGKHIQGPTTSQSDTVETTCQPGYTRRMRQRIRFCTTSDDVRIAYATAGQGPPLLRVGGWLTHVEQDWQSPVWRHWLQALTARHTLARFDIRGSGLSDRNAEVQEMDAWLRDLDAVVTDLGWNRFSMLGLCQGGAIATAYAALHPDRIDHLVLYNSYLAGPLATDRESQLARQAGLLADMIRLGWGQATPAFRDVFARLLMPRGTEEQLGWWDQLQRITAEPDTAARLWLAFNGIDIRKRVSAITAPTLVCHSRHDAMVPFEAGRRLAAALPHAVFLPLESENHVLQPNEPAWPVFLSAVEQFLLGESDLMAGDGLPANLTTRERSVLGQVARGHSNTEIAETLHLAPKTVRNHICNICGKLGVNSRAQAIVRARDAGLGRD